MDVFPRNFQDLLGMGIALQQNLKIGGQPPNLSMGDGEFFR